MVTGLTTQHLHERKGRVQSRFNLSIEFPNINLSFEKYSYFIGLHHLVYCYASAPPPPQPPHGVWMHYIVGLSIYPYTLYLVNVI